jgi:hypothetical protein
MTITSVSEVLNMWCDSSGKNFDRLGILDF